MKPKLILVVGAFFYALSWFLPVLGMGPRGTGRFMGWDAFMVAIWPFEGSDEPWYRGVHFVASALTNFVLVAALALVLLARRKPSRMLQVLVAASAILNTHWVLFTFGSDRGDLRIGYYLWAISFFIVAAGLMMMGSNRAGPVPAQRESPGVA